MAFNTGNPLGSTDPRDLSDNAENFDKASNSSEPTFADRLGATRKTLSGMESEFNTDQSSRETTFQAFISSSGYEFLGDYAASIEVTAYNQVIRESGEFWKPAASTSLPYTTTGAGMPEGGAFVSVGDANLRQEVGGGIRRVSNLTALEGISGRFSGDAAYMVGRTAAGDGGEGEFSWDGSDLSSTIILASVTSTSVDSGTDTITSAGHGLVDGDGVVSQTAVNGLSLNTVYWVVNATTDTFQLSATFGGAVFDLTGTTNLTVDHLRDPLKGVYVTAPDDLAGVNGAWVRQTVDNEIASVDWFGAIPDTISRNNLGTDNSSAFQAAINYALSLAIDVFIPAGKYYAHDLKWGAPVEYDLYSREMSERGVMMRGEGKASSRIFTGGANFIDVGEFKNFAGRDFAVLSTEDTSAPIDSDAPLGIRPRGLGIYTSATSGVYVGHVSVELHEVDLHRFLVAVDCGEGGWLSKIYLCHFKFCEIGIRIGGAFACSIEKNNFVCKTAIKTSPQLRSAIALEYNNNHHDVGTYTAILGVPQALVSIAPGSGNFKANYFEAYSTPDANTIIWDLYVRSGNNAIFENNYVNLGSNVCISRKMTPASATVTNLTNIVFNGIGVDDLSPNALNWESGGDPSDRIIITDNTGDVAPIDSAVYAANKQEIAIRTTSYSYTSGTTEPSPDIYDNKDTNSYVGDDHVLQPDNSMHLRTGLYKLSAYAKNTTTSGKDVYLEIAFSSDRYQIPLIVDGEDYGGTITIYVPVERTYAVDWYFPVALAGGDTFSISSLLVSLEPLTSYSIPA